MPEIGAALWIAGIILFVVANAVYITFNFLAYSGNYKYMVLSKNLKVKFHINEEYQELILVIFLVMPFLGIAVIPNIYIYYHVYHKAK